MRLISLFWLKIPSLYWLCIVCSVKEQKQCLDLCIFSFVHNVKLKGRIRERVKVTIKIDYPFWFRRAFYRHFPKSYRHCLLERFDWKFLAQSLSFMSAKPLVMEVTQIRTFIEGCSLESQTKVRTLILIYCWDKRLIILPWLIISFKTCSKSNSL